MPGHKGVFANRFLIAYTFRYSLKFSRVLSALVRPGSRLLGTYQPIFSNQTSDLIGHGNTVALDLVRDTTHCLEILLFNPFRFDWMHVGPTHRFVDRLRIIGIALVAIEKRPYKLQVTILIS
jgi:hypothetical protein